ncbi:MAG: hypothetical protein LBE78_01555 [Burkholderiaceae bacterium]|jgi:hypothetical protein|nr:hypothetical protein [Burkholderiaceae bacterium]
MRLERIKIPVVVQQRAAVFDAPGGETVSMVLRTVTPSDLRRRKFLAACKAMSRPPKSTISIAVKSLLA